MRLLVARKVANKKCCLWQFDRHFTNPDLVYFVNRAKKNKYASSNTAFCILRDFVKRWKYLRSYILSSFLNNLFQRI